MLRKELELNPFRLKSGWQCSEKMSARTRPRLTGWQCSEKFGAEPPFRPLFTSVYTRFGWLCSEMEAGFAIEILGGNAPKSVVNPRKTQIISCNCGVPFLGAIVCPNGRFLRSRTRRHLDRRWTEVICSEPNPYVLQSVRNSRESFLMHFNGND